MRMQRQPKRVTVTCVNTALQSWSHQLPTMTSISLAVSPPAQPHLCLVHPLNY